MSNKSYDYIEVSECFSDNIVVNWVMICKCKSFDRVYNLLGNRKYNLNSSLWYTSLLVLVLTFSIPYNLIRNISMIISMWDSNLSNTIMVIRSVEYDSIRGRKILVYFGEIICNGGKGSIELGLELLGISKVGVDELVSRLSSVSSEFRLSKEYTGVKYLRMIDPDSGELHVHPGFKDPETGSVLYQTSNLDFPGSNLKILNHSIKELELVNASRPGTVVEEVCEVIGERPMNREVLKIGVEGIMGEYGDTFSVKREKMDEIIYDGEHNVRIFRKIDVIDGGADFEKKVRLGRYHDIMRNPELLYVSARLRDDSPD